MRVLVTGASGLLGSRLVDRLRERGDSVRVVTRGGERLFPVGVERIVADLERESLPAGCLDRVDAVVGLAGEPLARRWTAARQRSIRESRVAGTTRLVQAMRAAARPPAVLVSASAVGAWGDRGDELLDEEASVGTGFLAEVCRDWEGAALAAPAGTRVVLLRTGMILSLQGGALPRMLPPFRWGVGGRLGSGRQWVSWIHLDDAVGLILHALDRADVDGPLALVAPHPVRNADLTRILGQVLHRPTIFPVPALALRVLFGEMASVLLASQRVEPKKALATGYVFREGELRGALEGLLGSRS